VSSSERIVTCLAVGFSREAAERDSIRAIKASPDSGATGVQILGLIQSPLE
jgi:ABC-type taurine transport system ATPase subunit